MQLGTIEGWELWHEVETHTKYWFKDIRLVKDVLKTFVTACECRNSGNPQAQLWGNQMRAWTRRVLRDFLKPTISTPLAIGQGNSQRGMMNNP